MAAPARMAAARSPARTDQGRPLGRLCRALSRQERPSRRASPKRCTIQVAYAIGIAKPLSVYVETRRHGQGRRGQAVARPAGADGFCRRAASAPISGSNKPIYARTAAYGQFSVAHRKRMGGFSWERLDLVDELRRAF